MDEIKRLKTENSRLLRALDLLAMALNSHGHQWTPEEQQAYEKVAKVNKLSPNLDTPVEELEVSIRVENALRINDIKYIGDLVQKTEQEMRRIPNFGNKSLNELKEILHPLGLHFGMHLPHWGSKAKVIETEEEILNRLMLEEIERDREVDIRVLRVLEKVFGVEAGGLGKFINNPGKGREAVLHKIYSTKYIEAYLEKSLRNNVLSCLRSILSTKALNARVEEAIAELDRGREK